MMQVSCIKNEAVKYYSKLIMITVNYVAHNCIVIKSNEIEEVKENVLLGQMVNMWQELNQGKKHLQVSW